MSLALTLCLAATAAIAWGVWRAVEWLWILPRRLERALRSLGLQGNHYRFPYGDIKDDARFSLEARKKPIPLSHRITARVVPNLHRAFDINGSNKLAFSWFGPYPRLIIMDPEMVKEILNTKSGNIQKSRINPFAKFLASGVATYEGEKWANHRRIINPAFHVEKLKCMMPAFTICCDELITRWENQTSVKGSCELDLWPEFVTFTGDVISRAAFGSSYKQGQRIFELQFEQGELLMQTFRSLYFPGFRFLPTKKNRRRNEIHREVIALIKGMIMQKEEAIRKGEARTDDLLGLLLEYSQRHSNEDVDHSKNVGLTTEDVIEECKLFYFAGQETTSILLTWTMVVLSMHPDWQERARDEIFEVFGQNRPNFDGLSRLKVVTMILYEVLRLYPPGPFITRQIYQESKLGDFILPAGVQLLIPIILIHHSKEFWGEDADEFNPERFAAGLAKATKNQLVFLPFGWGPRICLGQSFALVEAKMGLARILQRFKFELSPSYAHAPSMVLTLRPQFGAQIILHRL
ncbi:hypothetical protein HPP92_009771 [Vanilla planifolia]|uniref:Cytochrome P450 n=1 Tax=Vanilla planifolia TaxID=51239 RepID=A0A835V960_VANPL|nr:hypothetical protein HPP92_009771 [Vanilla planifolia]